MQKYRTAGGPSFNSNDADEQEQDQITTQSASATAILGKVKQLQKQKQNEVNKNKNYELHERCICCGREERTCGGDKFNGKWAPEWRRKWVREVMTYTGDLPNDAHPALANKYAFKEGKAYTIQREHTLYPIKADDVIYQATGKKTFRVMYNPVKEELYYKVYGQDEAVTQKMTREEFDKLNLQESYM